MAKVNRSEIRVSWRPKVSKGQKPRDGSSNGGDLKGTGVSTVDQ